jgi:acyl-CoA thioester hydrolase
VILPVIIAADGPPAGRSVTRTRVSVRIAETDLMGVVHHASYLLYFEDARIAYLARRGARYADWIAGGIHFSVVDQHVRYRAPARFGDGLEIEVWVGASTRVTIRFDYRVSRSGARIAEGETTLACVDAAGAPRRIPAEMLDQMLGPEHEP